MLAIAGLGRQASQSEYVHSKIDRAAPPQALLRDMSRQLADPAKKEIAIQHV
jgi:hypothetical protein